MQTSILRCIVAVPAARAGGRPTKRKPKTEQTWRGAMQEARSATRRTSQSADLRQRVRAYVSTQSLFDISEPTGQGLNCFDSSPNPLPRGGRKRGRGGEGVHSPRWSRRETPWKKGTYFGALLATRATNKEYSGELGSQNASKMETKMEPKVIQKGSLLKNTKSQFGPLFTTLEPCRPPPKRLLFRQFLVAVSRRFSRHKKKHRKIDINAPFGDSGAQMTPKVTPGAPPKEVKIHPKSSQNPSTLRSEF